jgi:hypothetical protein
MSLSWKAVRRFSSRCAIWTKRDAAAAHLGEASPLARLAADRKAACARFAEEFAGDGWLPKAIVDSVPSRATPASSPTSK